MKAKIEITFGFTGARVKVTNTFVSKIGNNQILKERLLLSIEKCITVDVAYYR